MFISFAPSNTSSRNFSKKCSYGCAERFGYEVDLPPVLYLIIAKIRTKEKKFDN